MSEIPLELVQLSNLQNLDLRYNNLKGSILPELSNLSNLQELDLSSNQLTGTIPPELGKLSNLEYLCLSSNQLMGTIPPELGNLSNLKDLELNSNQLTGSIPLELGNLSALTWLSLSSNQLTGPIPPELGNLSNLEYLDLRANQLMGTIPPELGNLFMLTKIDLSFNQLTGAIPPTLGNLLKLESFYLDFNQLTGSIPPELGNLSMLTKIDLSSNQLMSAIPSSLGNFSKLEALYLDSNHLSGSIPPELGKLSNLRYLYLHSNQITGPIPPELGNLSMLQEFNLNSNQLMGSIPPELGNLDNIKNLDLHGNQLTGSIPPELGKHSKMPKFWFKNLDLSFNHLTGLIPPELGILVYLEKLNLNDNQLTGPIPPGLGDYIMLRELNLSSNRLTGPIPPELSHLLHICSLALSSNQLTGSIPSELSNLSLLQELFLNSNQLTGRIPDEIKNLENLSNSGSDFRWNGFYTANNSLKNLLNIAQIGGNWESTQTITPASIIVSAKTATSIQIRWLPIAYTSDKGGYRIFYSLTPDGPYTFFGATKAKYDYQLEVTGLNPATKYYFVVQTQTEPHEHNQNSVESEYSTEVSAETLDTARLISGQVATVTGKKVEGVTLIFSPSNEFTITDVSGNYRHAIEIGWSGIVEPTKTGYSFEPEKRIFSNVTNHQPGTDFRAIPIYDVISGKVTSAGEGAAGVTLSFKADDGETETTLTNSDGSYSHEVLYGWIGRVTPSKNDLLFDPPFIDYSFPGITEGRNHQDYRLSISLNLQVTRKKDNTLIIRKEYGEIELNINLINIASSAVQKFVIFRKKSGDFFLHNKEFVIQEQKNSFQFTYRDEYLEKGKTYIYIARAIDRQDKVIGESEEATITGEI